MTATLTSPRPGAPAHTDKVLVNYEVRDGLAIITLNDPPANTYTYEMFRQLDAAILDARMADEAHVIVIRGHGEKFFSAGANISMLNSVTPRFKYFFCLHANETLSRLEQTPKLTIAALNGHTVGGGLEIAMACDMRIACRNAGKIGLPEVNLGVLPGTGGTQRLCRLIGKSAAIEFMVTGETFSFEKAEEMGLVNHVFEKDGFWEQVRENEDDLRWCGAAPLYAFLKATAPGCSALLRYEQWNIDPASVVSFAALAFGRGEAAPPGEGGA